MKNQKKVIAMLLIMILTVCFAMPVGATGTQSITGTGEAAGKSTSVTYDVSQAFTVTIPESVTFDTVSRIGSGTVTVTNCLIQHGQTLKVTIKAASNYDAVKGFRLRDGSKDSYIEYSIKKDGDSLAINTAFLSVVAGNDSGSATLNFEAAAPTKAGDYADSLTFTVAVE